VIEQRMAARPPALVALIALAIAILTAACSGSTPTLAPSLPAVTVPSFAPDSTLEATLPTSVGGVQLLTASASAAQAYYASGTPLYGLTVLIAGAGAHPAQVGVAAAADTGGKIQIPAARFQGVETAAIQASVEALAKQADPNVTIKHETIGGKQVTTATYSGSQIEPIVAYVTGDTVYFVKASDQALVEDALRQLP